MLSFEPDVPFTRSSGPEPVLDSPPALNGGEGKRGDEEEGAIVSEGEGKRVGGSGYPSRLPEAQRKVKPESPQPRQGGILEQLVEDYRTL